MANHELAECLGGRPSAAAAVVAALRDVIRREVPDAQESFLWGGLSYHRPSVGGRVKGSVCMIDVRGGSVRLDFLHGVRLPDPHGLLRGDALSKRFMQVATVREARGRKIAALIRAAAAVNFRAPA